MQRTLVVAFGCATLVLAIVCLLQALHISGQNNRLAVLALTVEQDASKLQKQEVALKELRGSGDSQKADAAEQQQKLTISQAVKAKAKKSRSAKATPASDVAAGENGDKDKGNFLGKMMNDPEMKKMMQQQQKAVFQKMYAPLFKELNLSPEESEKLNTMLLDTQMKNMDAGMSLLQDGSDKKAVGEQLAADKKASDEQVKALLGDQRYKQYDEFQNSIGDRTMLDQFKMQNADFPLTEDQSKQLLQAMVEERKKSGQINFSKPENLELLSSSDAVDKWSQQQAAVNKNVLERAANFLSPDQFTAFDAFQSNQVQMQEMGIKMAQKMFGAKTNAPAAP